MEWVYGREKKIFWQRKKTGRNTLHMFVPCRECSHRNLYTMISLCGMVGIGGITPFYGHGFGVRHTPEYNQPQWRYSGDIMVYIYMIISDYICIYGHTYTYIYIYYINNLWLLRMCLKIGDLPPNDGHFNRDDDWSMDGLGDPIFWQTRAVCRNLPPNNRTRLNLPILVSRILKISPSFWGLLRLGSNYVRCNDTSYYWS